MVGNMFHKEPTPAAEPDMDPRIAVNSGWAAPLWATATYSQVAAAAPDYHIMALAVGAVGVLVAKYW